ncbi:MAG: trigger factor [Phycisphaeraceae bacterium]|nr:trigger factor [Phycisphaeraceae bacterium]
MSTMQTSPADAASFDPIVTVSDAGPCRKKLHIEAPAEAVRAALGSTFDTLMGAAVIKGFRQGKAPRALVERMYGKAARDEARNRIVSAAYSKAIEKHKLRVLGEPDGGDELKDADLSGDKPLKFTVEVEVAPEFTLPALDAIGVKKPMYEVTDELVAEQVERFQVNEGDLQERDVAQRGDYCMGHGTIVVKGQDKPALDINGAVIQIPKEGVDKGQILGVLVEDFAKQVGLPKKGDTVTVKAKGPEGHETESVRGKDLTITFEIANVYRIEPLPIDTLCERFGFENEAGLRDAMRSRLQQRVLIQQQSAMRQQIADYLLKNTEMELPQKLSAQQAERRLQRARLELMYRGLDPIAVEDRVAELRSQSHELSSRELKLFFILDKVATDFNVGVTEGEVNGRIAQMAYERNERPEKLRNDLIENRQIGFVVQQVREHKAMDQLLSKAKVDEVAADKFDAEMKKSAGA